VSPGDDIKPAAAPILKMDSGSHLASDGGVANRFEMLTNKTSALKFKVI
jgi:hypothetical protein